MFGKNGFHTEEEYSNIIQAIKSQVSQDGYLDKQTSIKDEFSTQLVSERIEKLEQDKQLLKAQIELFQSLIAEMHPRLDEIITELARLKAMTI